MANLIKVDHSGKAAKPDQPAQYYPRLINAEATSMVKLAYSEDGTRLASLSYDHEEPTTLQLWDTDFNELIWARLASGYVGPECAEEVVLNFPSNREPCAAFFDRHMLKIHGLELSDVIDPMAWMNVGPLTISPNGKFLVHVWDGKNVNLWTTDTNLWPSGHIAKLMNQPVSGLTFSSDSNLLALSSDEGSVEIWDMTMVGHDNSIGRHKIQAMAGELTVVFSSHGKIMTCASAKGYFSTWDTSSWSSLNTFGDGKRSRAVAFTSDGKTFVSMSSETNDFTTWSVASGTKLGAIKNNMDKVSTIAISPDGELLATISGNDSPILWNLRTGNQHQHLKGHGSPVINLVFSPNSKQLATSSDDGKITLWDASFDLPADQRARMERKFDRDMDSLYQVYTENRHGKLTEKQLEASENYWDYYQFAGKYYQYMSDDDDRYYRYDKNEDDENDVPDSMSPYSRQGRRLRKDPLMFGIFSYITGEKNPEIIVEYLMRYSFLGVALLAYESSSEMVERIEQAKLDLAFRQPYRWREMSKVQDFVKKHGMGGDRYVLQPHISSKVLTSEMNERILKRFHIMRALSTWLLQSHLAEPLARKLHDKEALDQAKEYVDVAWETEKMHVTMRAAWIEQYVYRPD